MIEILEYSVYYGDSTILRKLRLWKKIFQNSCSCFAGSSSEWTYSGWKGITKIPQGKESKCYTGVGYLYYGSKTTHYRVLAEIGYENHRFRFEIRFRYQSPGRTTPPKTLESIPRGGGTLASFKCPHALHFYPNFFLFSGSLHRYIIYDLGRKYRFRS